LDEAAAEWNWRPMRCSNALAWQVARHVAGTTNAPLLPDFYEALDCVLSRAESPIESAFLAATIMHWSHYQPLWIWLGRSWRRPMPARFVTLPAMQTTTHARDVLPPAPFNYPRLREVPRAVLYPQLRVGPYRADIFVVLEQAAATSDGRTRKTMVVECDGHEFHEKTKEQASADKARDRYLQARGHLVFRFSGSDIWRNPFGCAHEALTALRRAARA